MIDTFNSLIKNKKGLLKITDQVFSDEIISNNSANSAILIKTMFKNCTFDLFHFRGAAFSQCTFKDCTFLESDFKATEIYQCNFDNCTTINSNFIDSVISETNFNNCQFEETCFDNGSFEDCNFQETKFQNLDNDELFAMITNSKVSTQYWSISFNGDFDFDKVVEFVNSIEY